MLEQKAVIGIASIITGVFGFNVYSYSKPLSFHVKTQKKSDFYGKLFI